MRNLSEIFKGIKEKWNSLSIVDVPSIEEPTFSGDLASAHNEVNRLQEKQESLTKSIVLENGNKAENSLPINNKGVNVISQSKDIPMDRTTTIPNERDR